MTTSPPPGFALRRYRAGDHDAVWDLHNAALNSVGAHGGNGAWDDDLHTIEDVYLNDGGEFLVGELDGRIVAMGALKRESDDTAAIRRMRVAPDLHRRGIGRQVLVALEEAAVRLGYRRIVLDTTTIQEPAISLYRAHGYVETGRSRLGVFEVIAFEKTL